MRVRLVLFGRDVFDLTATRSNQPEPDDPPEPFGFIGGSTMWTERAEPFDEADELTE